MKIQSEAVKKDFELKRKEAEPFLMQPLINSKT